jgi:hypothetical protein
MMHRLRTWNSIHCMLYAKANSYKDAAKMKFSTPMSYPSRERLRHSVKYMKMTPDRNSYTYRQMYFCDNDHMKIARGFIAWDFSSIRIAGLWLTAWSCPVGGFRGQLNLRQVCWLLTPCGLVDLLASRLRAVMRAVWWYKCRTSWTDKWRGINWYKTHMRVQIFSFMWRSIHIYVQVHTLYCM